MNEEEVQFLAISPDGHTFLTRNNVRYQWIVSGQSRLISITLDAVSSCSLSTISYPLLLVLGIIAAVVGAFLFISGKKPQAAMAIAAAVLLILFYTLTRLTAMIISSSGESIKVRVNNLSHDAFVQFINAVETAKIEFLRTL